MLGPKGGQRADADRKGGDVSTARRTSREAKDIRSRLSGLASRLGLQLPAEWRSAVATA